MLWWVAERRMRTRPLGSEKRDAWQGAEPVEDPGLDARAVFCGRREQRVVMSVRTRARE